VSTGCIRRQGTTPLTPPPPVVSTEGRIDVQYFAIKTKQGAGKPGGFSWGIGLRVLRSGFKVEGSGLGSRIKRLG